MDPDWATDEWAVAYQRILGEELRKLRDLRGWTLRQLRSELGLAVAVPTLTTYELGSRQVSAVRLTQICLALGEDVGVLLARVHDRLFAGTASARVWLVVDLVAVSRLADPRLLPLRGWARARLRAGQPGTVRILSSGLGALAGLCGVDVGELRQLLPPPRAGGGADVVPLCRPVASGTASARSRDPFTSSASLSS